MWQFFISILVGISASHALVSNFLKNDNLSAIDQLFLLAVPAISAAICIYSALPILTKIFHQTSTSTKAILFFLALLADLFILAPDFKTGGLPFISAFAALLALFFAATIPASPFLQKFIDTKDIPYLFLGWVVSTTIIFFIAGFLDNFYNKFVEFACIITVLQVTAGSAGYFLVRRLGNFARQQTVDFVIFLLLFLVLFCFTGIMFQFGKQTPALFHPAYFLVEKSLLPLFGAVSLLSLPWQAWVLTRLESTGIREKFKRTKAYAFINENLAGLALALTFFAIYLLIATALNHSRFDVDDIFFDADIFNWRLRLTTDNWQDYYLRSVHPFVLLLLKPPIDLAAMFLHGDKLFGAYIVVALGGGLCVFLAWKFIKVVTGKPLYAALTASILGMSASHLVFGSLIETYIFLAAGLLLFFLLLLEKSSVSTLVLASLPVVGITYSNFAQNTLAFFTTKPSLKAVFRFVASTLVLLVLLGLLNNLLFPGAHPLFFIPSSLLAEEQNIFPLNLLRMQALTRAFLFHNVVAPTPILFTGDIPFTQFRFFKPEINELSRYDTPLQSFTAWFWLGLILLAVAAFLGNYKRYNSNRLSLALLGCMALNAGLHLRYGKELFLYSPNWTYALILLLALAWQGFAKHRWFQVTLLIFLVFLMLNNSLLMGMIFNELEPYLH